MHPHTFGLASVQTQRAKVNHAALITTPHTRKNLDCAVLGRELTGHLRKWKHSEIQDGCQALKDSWSTLQKNNKRVILYCCNYRNS